MHSKCVEIFEVLAVRVHKACATQLDLKSPLVSQHLRLTRATVPLLMWLS